jgi:hypothetical protein
MDLVAAPVAIVLQSQMLTEDLKASRERVIDSIGLAARHRPESWPSSCGNRLRPYGGSRTDSARPRWMSLALSAPCARKVIGLARSG